MRAGRGSGRDLRAWVSALVPHNHGAHPLIFHPTTGRRAAACALGGFFVVANPSGFAAQSQSAQAANIPWTGSGAYEVCLQAGADAWLSARAEDVVMGAASIKALDDAKVAGATIEIMRSCAAKGQASDAGNDAVFGKYMARWREHLYELARVIRAKGGSD